MLKLVVDSLDGIEEAFHKLYTEKNGKFHLTGVEGMKTSDDIAVVQRSLDAERAAHKETKTKLDEYKDIRALGQSADEILQKLDSYDELKAAADGKIDEKKIDEMVETRIKTRLTPIKRERDNFKAQVEERDQTIAGYQGKEKQRTIEDAVREAAVKAKVVPTAIDDVLMMAGTVFDIDEHTGKVITKENSGVLPGIDPSVFLTEIQEKRPHWWAPSNGGGANGGNSSGPGGINPFTHDGWNLTAQGQMVKENREKAEQLAKSAGTTIGGARPPKKK